MAGFLKKLFGDAGSEINLDKLVKQVSDLAEKVTSEAGEAAGEFAKRGEAKATAPSYVEASGPSGDSWGPVMPAEENQFNYSGSYEQYFTHVFEEEFPNYEVRKAVALRSDSTVFTFWQGGRKALVVEVMSQNSSAKKLRSDCARDGIPYLRFYHNHDGWWNTRSYVTKRVQGALGGI